MNHWINYVGLGLMGISTFGLFAIHLPRRERWKAILIALTLTTLSGLTAAMNHWSVRH